MSRELFGLFAIVIALALSGCASTESLDALNRALDQRSQARSRALDRELAEETAQLQARELQMQAERERVQAEIRQIELENAALQAHSDKMRSAREKLRTAMEAATLASDKLTSEIEVARSACGDCFGDDLFRRASALTLLEVRDAAGDVLKGVDEIEALSPEIAEDLVEMRRVYSELRRIAEVGLMAQR